MPIIRMPDGQKVRFSDDWSKEQIRDAIATKYPDFAKKMGYKQPQPLTEEQQEAIRQQVKEMNPRSLWGKTADFMVTNPVAREVGLALQGAANASLNPFGYVARAMGNNTRPLEAQNWVERGTELAGEYGFDAAALGGAGNIAKGAGYLGKGEGVASQIAQKVLAPEDLPQALYLAASAAGGGLVEGAVDPESATGKFVANTAGAFIPGSIEGTAKKVPQLVKGGLANAVGNTKATKMINSGIRANERVAQEVADVAPRARAQLKEEIMDTMDSTLRRRVDAEKAIENQEERLKNFLDFNSDYPVFTNKKPYKQEENMFELLVNDRAYNRVARNEKANKGDSLLTFLIKRGGLKDVGGELKSMDAGKSRVGIINNKSGKSIDEMADLAWQYGYFPEKSERPDVNDFIEAIRDETFGRKRFPEEHFTQRYNESMKERVDALAQEMDMLGVDYSNMNAKEAERAYKNAVEEWRMSNGKGSDMPNFEEAKRSRAEVPYYDDVFGGLKTWQKEKLEKALAEGISKTDSPRGTLGSTYEAKKLIGDWIKKSYIQKPWGEEPSSETALLQKVKSRLDNLLETSIVKDIDRSYEKAKRLKDAYEIGKKIRPSETKFENLRLKTLREKNSFLQGRFARILDNVKEDTNLAKLVKEDEVMLSKVLPEKDFNRLMKKARQIDTRMKRLNALENRAERKLVTDAARKLGWWREFTESVGSMVGGSIDKTLDFASRGARSKAASRLINSPEWTTIIEPQRLLGGAEASSRQGIIDLLNYYNTDGYSLDEQLR